MWSPDADEYIFDPDDPFYSAPVWKAIKLRSGKWKFWVTDKMGFPHHDAVLRRLGVSQTDGGALYSGDSLKVATDEKGEVLNPELHEVLMRNRRKYLAAAERASSSYDYSRVASTWVETEHPRHPGGTHEGGQFAPKHSAGTAIRKAFDERPEGFPLGEFDPDGDVKFWPTQLGYRDGAFWKGFLNARTGEPEAFWFVSPMGAPHHLDMANALDMDLTETTEGALGDFPRYLRVSGYGTQPDTKWMQSYILNDLGVEHDYGNAMFNLYMAKAALLVDQHRRDIRDAGIMAEGPERLAAAGYPELLETEALAEAYARLWQRAMYAAARAYETANGQLAPLTAASAADGLSVAVRIALEAQGATNTRRQRLSRRVGVLVQKSRGTSLSQKHWAEVARQMGRKAASRLTEGVRADVSAAILRGLADGLSVPETAALIRERARNVSQRRSLMMARTDLVGMSNALDLHAVKLLEEGPRYKIWLATPDERTRLDHREAHGQVVPVDQPFEVNGEQLQYPADPQGSDENIINCRCTMLFTYAKRPEEPLPKMLRAAGTPWDEAEHPRHPKGSAQGGEFRPKKLPSKPVWSTLLGPRTSGVTADAINEAIYLVNDTMRFPDVFLPGGGGFLTMRVGDRAKGIFGWYDRDPRSRKPREIVIRHSAEYPQSVAVHEIGHLFDHMLGQYGDVGKEWADFASAQPNGPLEPVMKVIRDTKTYKDIQYVVDSGRPLGYYEYTPPGQTESMLARVTAEHAAYLNRPTETIARSFERYIADKNPDSPMAKEFFEKGRSGKAHAIKDRPGAYFTDAESKKINAAYDRVLKRLGLLP